MKPIDPHSEVVDSNRRITPEWYRFISQLALVASLSPTTVAELPLPGSAGAGTRGFVTDASVTTFGSVVAGGGANKVPVVSDGTNWIIG